MAKWRFFVVSFFDLQFIRGIDLGQEEVFDLFAEYFLFAEVVLLHFSFPFLYFSIFLLLFLDGEEKFGVDIRKLRFAVSQAITHLFLSFLDQLFFMLHVLLLMILNVWDSYLSALFFKHEVLELFSHLSFKQLMTIFFEFFMKIFSLFYFF